MSQQGEWEEITGIGNRTSPPSDWPETYTLTLTPIFDVGGTETLKALYGWCEMGGSCSKQVDSDGNYPRTFSKGDKVKIRYMIMEVDWV